MNRIILSIVIGVTLVSAVPSLAVAQRCTTRWNSLLRQYETRCDDGTTQRDQYNDLLRQWDTTIQRGQPGQFPQERWRRTTYNEFLRQWQTVCD